MELTEQADRVNEFDKGYNFGKQEMLYFLIHNPKYSRIRDGEFCISIDTLKSIQNEEQNKNGIIKQ